MGWLITVSGLDGAGKSTLIETLTEKVTSAGRSVKFVRIRLGFTPVLEKLKQAARINENNSSSSTASSLEKDISQVKGTIGHLYRLVSILDLIALFTWLSLLRAAGKFVITDRFYWDNQIIYQEKYGLPGWLARVLWRIARVAAGKPDASVLLLIPAEESYRRVVARNKGETEESLEVLARRALLYAELDQPQLVAFDGMHPPDEVFRRAWAHLMDIMV